jgi:hypothetical protein
MKSCFQGPALHIRKLHQQLARGRYATGLAIRSAAPFEGRVWRLEAATPPHR